MLFVDCPRPVYMYIREIGSMTAEYVHNNIISSYLQQSREREEPCRIIRVPCDQEPLLNVSNHMLIFYNKNRHRQHTQYNIYNMGSGSSRLSE